MKRKKITSLFLALMVTACSALSCYGATTQEKISNAQTKKQEAEDSYHAAQSRISVLESKKGELEAYLSELNAQLAELTANMESLQTQYAEKQAELEDVQAELEEAKALEEEQYEDMKLRIQYMYENSGTAYIEMLFGSESFTDFLNRAEQMTQIASYDRDMLKEYQETKDEIAKHEAQVVEEQAAIAALQEESQAKQEEVTELVQATYDQINTYAIEITEEESAAGDLLAQVRAQEDNLNTLLKQAKDEEAAREVAKEQTSVKTEEVQKEQEVEENVSESVREEEPEEDTSSSAESEGTNEETSSEQSSGNGTYLGKFRLTAYCKCSSCCGAWANGKTASGTTATQGRTVAMGGVPFGTKLLINGTVYTVEDRGTAYGHVDIYFDTHASALAFGSKYAEVYQVN